MSAVSQKQNETGAAASNNLALYSFVIQTINVTRKCTSFLFHKIWWPTLQAGKVDDLLI